MNEEKSKLTGVYFNNFQNIKGPTFISLENLTFLYGPNSSGKSAILDVIKVISEFTQQKTDSWRSTAPFWKINQDEDKAISIGIEFITGKLQYESPLEQKWFQSGYVESGQHVSLLHSLIGKKIQVEFGNNGESIKIAIQGKPFFEISNKTFLLNFGTADYSKEVVHSIEDEYELFGQLIIYKNNFVYDLISQQQSNLWGMMRNGPTKRKASDGDKFYSKIIEESESAIYIKGIEFERNGWEAEMVEVSHVLSQLSSYKFTQKLNEDKLISSPNEFSINENFNTESPLFKDNHAYREYLLNMMGEVSRELSFILEGIFFQIRDAIQYSHVEGGRGMLDSKLPFDVPQIGLFSYALKAGSNSDHVKAYANYLCSSKKITLNYGIRPNIKFDFINQSLQRYMKSMSSYKIIPRSYQIILGDNIPPNKNYNAYYSRINYMMLETKSGKLLGFQDVGSGFSYTLPILTSLWASKFSIIEQPELHLHPKAQCELGDVFLSAYSNGSVALIESHSEHILLRVLRRIRETTLGVRLPKELKINSENVSIYYFEPDSSGRSIVRKIRVDRYGELMDLWPGGFFAERDGELFT